MAIFGVNEKKRIGDGLTITGSGTAEDPFVAVSSSLWQQKQNEILNQLWVPSTGELQVIHDVLYANGIDLTFGGMKKCWSSCDVDVLTAYYFDMSTDSIGIDDKEQSVGLSVIRCNKFTTTETLSLGELTNHGGYVFYIVNNGADFTYWEAFKTDNYSAWHGTGSWFYTGTTSQSFGEGENNTNEIIALDEYHFTLAYRVRSIPITVDNSQIIEPKNERFIETADIIDIDKYLKKDTTLQTSDTPEETSLFSFWKIGIGRVKIAWSDLLNTLHHNRLIDLDWLSSGHTGNDNKIFGSDALGVAKEYALTDLETQNVTTSATSGIITLAKQTVTTLTTTLTNAHTLTIIPELPTVFTNRNYSEVVLTVGATAPSITWAAPSGVTLNWKDGEPTNGLAINKRHSIMYDWESETMCIVRREKL